MTLGTLAALSVPACSSSSSPSASSSSPLCPSSGKGRCIAIAAGTSENDISAAFASTQDGDTIAFAPGTFSFQRELDLGTGNGVTVIGSGQGQTVLDFAHQIAGGESGIQAKSVSGVVFEGFTVENTPGNGIKALMVNGATFRNLTVTWLGLASAGDAAAVTAWEGMTDAAPPAGLSDGPYGLYPVLSTNVLVEHCSISGASDTGIYVGQSQNIVIRDNESFANVAGIEIENSISADVHDNYAHDNTGGILIFALPGLKKEGTKNVRVYANHISANNRPNFAPMGDIVGLVPAGTGFFVMAADHVEVFGNLIEGNGTGGAGVISYYLPGLVMPTTDTSYYEYPSYVDVHDNTYIGNGTMPDTTGPTSGTLGMIIANSIAMYPGMRMPDVAYDGVADPALASMGSDPMHICVHEASTTTFCDGHYDMLTVPGSHPTCDVTPFACTLPAIAPVTFPGLAP